jgi:hypothetical protein
MKKNILFTLLILLLSSTTQAQSVMVNGNVDGWDSSNGIYWWWSQVNAGMGAAGTIDTETADVQQGARSIKAVITAVHPTDAWCVQLLNSNAGSTFYPLTALKPDGSVQYYTLRYWAKADAGQSMNMFMQNSSYGSPAFTDRTLTSSWAQYSFTFNIPADESLRPGFHLGKAVGTYYLDNFEFGTIEQIALPVNLMSFQATENTRSQSIALNWQVASERNMKSYVVQRSADGKKFEDITTLVAKNLEDRVNYSFEDKNPLKNINYYRLSMIENDGSFKFSHIQTARIEEKNAVTIAPNPTTNYFEIKGIEAFESIDIYDINGRVVRQFKSNNPSEFDVSNLEKGVYHVAIKSQNGISISKLLKI